MGLMFLRIYRIFRSLTFMARCFPGATCADKLIARYKLCQHPYLYNNFMLVGAEYITSKEKMHMDKYNPHAMLSMMGRGFVSVCKKTTQ